jgi:hypothetical protein
MSAFLGVGVIISGSFGCDLDRRFLFQGGAQGEAFSAMTVECKKIADQKRCPERI